ncbi:MAG: hypothetical protein FWD60_04685 [Candidatus Azobacteroides sp.]|nr:hypothetical protein [Candidatus Azobacteroides sp.]
MKATRLFAILFISFFLFVGCKTKYIPVEQTHTEYLDRFVRDSIYMRDSIYIHEKGDTVFYYRDRYVYVNKIKHDSIYIHDSIPYEVQVIKEKITNKLTWLQQTQVYIGWLAITGLLVFLFIKYKSKLLSIIVSLIK